MLKIVLYSGLYFTLGIISFRSIVISDYCNPTNPCENGGVCLDHINSFTCFCTAGYTGMTCSDIDECSSQPCVHGACIDGINEYTCTCNTGYTGVNCVSNIDDCLSDPCQNGATCKDGVNLYTCICTGTENGATCSKSGTHRGINS